MIDRKNRAFAITLLIGAIISLSVAQAAILPDWGGPKTYPHFAVPWAFALDAPFQWTKQIASYFGGTKNGMLVVWPHHISDPGNCSSRALSTWFRPCSKRPATTPARV